ncbi:uncharacterized protein BCR38DRAFT_298186, partial [Pseudomassariella vexata]
STITAWLPPYSARDWGNLYGSVISSDASETTYTLFCAPETATDFGCYIGDAAPLTFVEGPSTLRQDASVTSSFEFTNHCTLTGTTEATCSFSSSIAPNVTVGSFIGPQSTSAVRTFTGTELYWGKLTLAAPPSTTVLSGSETSTFFPNSTAAQTSSPTPAGISGTSSGS